MKYREEAQSRSHNSLHTANQSLALTNAPSANPTSSLISTVISNPAPTSTPTSTTMSNAIIAPSKPPHPHLYITPLSLRVSFINPKEVEIFPPIESQRAKLTHQPLLYSPPRPLASIRVIPTQQTIPPTHQPIMADVAEQAMVSDESDTAQPHDSIPSKPVVEFREIYIRKALQDFHQDAL